MGLKLNLGCGEKYLPGYINCDISPLVKADKYFDLNQFPYPFADESADEILMDNVLEHLDNIVAVMQELYRILAPHGLLKIYVPYAKSDWAFQDPTHRHFFTEQTMAYFCETHPYAYYSPVKFRLLKVKFYAHSYTWRHKLRNLIPFRPILRYFLFNMYDGIYFELQKP